jgi:hypothetical protein
MPPTPRPPFVSASGPYRRTYIRAYVLSTDVPLGVQLEESVFSGPAGGQIDKLNLDNFRNTPCFAPQFVLIEFNVTVSAINVITQRSGMLHRVCESAEGGAFEVVELGLPHWGVKS